MHLTSTIIANNGSGGDCAGHVVSNGYNWHDSAISMAKYIQAQYPAALSEEPEMQEEVAHA